MNYKLCLFLASPSAPVTGAPSALPTALTIPAPPIPVPFAWLTAASLREGIAEEVAPTQEWRTLAGNKAKSVTGRGSWGLVTDPCSWAVGTHSQKLKPSFSGLSFLRVPSALSSL